MLKANSFPLFPKEDSYPLSSIAKKTGAALGLLEYCESLYSKQIGGVLPTEILSEKAKYTYVFISGEKKLGVELDYEDLKCEDLSPDLFKITLTTELTPQDCFIKIKNSTNIYSKNGVCFFLCNKIESSNSSWTLTPKWEKAFLALAELKLSKRQSNWYLQHLARLAWNENLNYDSDSFRVYHKEHENLSIDLYKDVLWFSYFKEEDLSDEVKSYFEKTKELLGYNHFLFRKMLNRGKDPEEKIRFNSKDLPESWLMEENGYKLLLKSNQGQSSGIFLDQRANRRWVTQNAEGKKLLNLFSYTSGFSVAAAMGGASEVVSVDTSKASLEWSKQSFTANHLSTENSYFYAMEADRFLDIAIKKKSQFDIIVCDPPSFARNKKSLFKIDEQIGPLLEKIKKCMAKEAYLLFSTNYEQWSQKAFEKEVSKVFTKSESLKINLIDDGDYEILGKQKILKYILLQKK
jgi:23S rRNA (cytosine1962-C5)-methyltransferase